MDLLLSCRGDADIWSDDQTRRDLSVRGQSCTSVPGVASRRGFDVVRGDRGRLRPAASRAPEAAVARAGITGYDLVVLCWKSEVRTRRSLTTARWMIMPSRLLGALAITVPLIGAATTQAASGSAGVLVAAGTVTASGHVVPDAVVR